MVSEKCVISTITVCLHLLMLSGIFYSESEWFSAPSQRPDLVLIFACTVFLFTMGVMAKIPQTRFGRHTVFFTCMVYSMSAIISLAGVHMIVGLNLWKVDSAQSEHLKELFSRYLVPYIFYWIFAVLITLVFGLMFSTTMITDSHIKNHRKAKAQQKKLTVLLNHTGKGDTSVVALANLHTLLSSHATSPWSPDFQRMVFKSFVAPQRCKSFSWNDLKTEVKCRVCEERFQPRETLYEHEKGIREECYHLKCILTSDYILAEEWDNVRHVALTHLKTLIGSSAAI